MSNPPALPPLLPPSWMSVRFSISRRDLVYCRLWVLAHNRLLLGIMAVGSIAPWLMGVSSGEFAARSVPFKVFYVGFCTTFTLAIMTVLNIAVQVFMVLINKNRGVIGARELEIRDDGLYQRSEVSESLHRWAGFHKIGSTSRFLFIFVTDNSVEYVPLQAFQSPNDASQFRYEIQKRAEIG